MTTSTPQSNRAARRAERAEKNGTGRTPADGDEVRITSPIKLNIPSEPQPPPDKPGIVAADTRAHAGVFGAPGEMVRLGPLEVQLSNLNLFGARDASAYINAHYPSRWRLGGDTVGEQIVEGCTATGDWDSLLGIIQWGIHQGHEVTLEQMGAADPSELAVIINRLFTHSGLRWLERIVKNSGEAMEAELLRRLQAAAPEMVQGYLRALGLDASVLYPAAGGTTNP